MAEPVKTVHDSISAKAVDHLGFPREPQIPTMARKVVIDACVPGPHPIQWYRDRGVNNLPPLTIDEQVNAIVECVKAGASVVHIHPRDPNKNFEPQVHATEILAEIVDRAMEQVDFVTCPHTWAWDFSKDATVDYVTYTEELLERGKGNKYCQAALVMGMGAFEASNVLFSRKKTIAGVQYMEANGVKPMYSMNSGCFRHYKEMLWDSGVTKSEPSWISLQMGKHRDDQVFADPWSYLQVINNISMIRSAIPNAFIGIHPGGRNWLPVATMGLLYGVELIRVGLEDLFYLWPHRDDISSKPSHSIEIVANIARNLGREIATAQDARERLNITLTSR